MRGADFQYFAYVDVPDCIFIRDMNCGNKSVTNDAEAVVREVNMAFPGKRIVYRDSEGDWAELAHNNGRFETFKPYQGPTPD